MLKHERRTDSHHSPPASSLHRHLPLGLVSPRSDASLPGIHSPRPHCDSPIWCRHHDSSTISEHNGDSSYDCRYKETFLSTGQLHRMILRSFGGGIWEGYVILRESPRSDDDGDEDEDIEDENSESVRGGDRTTGDETRWDDFNFLYKFSIDASGEECTTVVGKRTKLSKSELKGSHSLLVDFYRSIFREVDRHGHHTLMLVVTIACESCSFPMDLIQVTWHQQIAIPILTISIVVVCAISMIFTYQAKNQEKPNYSTIASSSRTSRPLERTKSMQTKT